MKKLGISVYPEKAPLNEWLSYIGMAADYGFTRIFSCLLSVDTEHKDKIISEFKEINSYARERGMEVIVDVAPRIFNSLGISYNDLSFFREIGADGIRLDMGYSGAEEAMMTFNEHGLSIEINMSNLTHNIDTIMDYMPNTNNLRGCHNFYPHRYTGLPEDYFLETTKLFKKYALRTAAFVSSQSASFGPWPVTDGLPTLDFLRDMPIDAQVKYYVSLNGLIDDVIISNCFASEDELAKVAAVNKDMVNFDIRLADNLPEAERKIILDEMHFRRGDINENMIRSSQPRVKYKGHIFEVFNTPDIKRGDVIIESKLYGHYAGELQIALKDMPNSQKSNVVGRISDSNLYLIDKIKPWQKFRFSKIQ